MAAVAADAAVLSALFGVLEARGIAAAERRAAEARARAAEMIGEEFDGIGARVEGEDVILEARGLWRRWLGDARLRWIGGMMR